MESVPDTQLRVTISKLVVTERSRHVEISWIILRTNVLVRFRN